MENLERYKHLNKYLKEKFGERTLKICIDGGFTCPNRDGSKSSKGCIFCSERGSGEHINGVTGSLSFEKVIELGNAIENKDVHKAVEIFNELISSGKEVSKIINSLLVFYRDVLLYKSIGDSGLSKFIFSTFGINPWCKTTRAI